MSHHVIITIDKKLHAAGRALAKQKGSNFSALVRTLLLQEMPDFKFDDDGSAAASEAQKLVAEAEKLLAHARTLQAGSTSHGSDKQPPAAPKKKRAGRGKA